jgi:hypothetical protein
METQSLKLRIDIHNFNFTSIYSLRLKTCLFSNESVLFGRLLGPKFLLLNSLVVLYFLIGEERFRSSIQANPLFIIACWRKLPEGILLILKSKRLGLFSKLTQGTWESWVQLHTLICSMWDKPWIFLNSIERWVQWSPLFLLIIFP